MQLFLPPLVGQCPLLTKSVHRVIDDLLDMCLTLFQKKASYITSVRNCTVMGTYVSHSASVKKCAELRHYWVRLHYYCVTQYVLIKFIYSEKATKFCEIFTVDLTVTT